VCNGPVAVGTMLIEAIGSGHPIALSHLVGPHGLVLLAGIPVLLRTVCDHTLPWFFMCSVVGVGRGWDDPFRLPSLYSVHLDGVL